MRVGVSIPLGSGARIYSSGGGAVAGVLLFSFLILCFEAVIGIVVLLVLALLGIAQVCEEKASQEREKEHFQALIAKSVSPSGLIMEGRYTNPRTWGVFSVPRLIKGERRAAYYFGNFPARRLELVSLYGEATTVAIYTSRLDAEELAYKLNGGTRRPA